MSTPIVRDFGANPNAAGNTTATATATAPPANSATTEARRVPPLGDAGAPPPLPPRRSLVVTQPGGTHHEPRGNRLEETGDGVGQGIRGAWHSFHGAGEQVRGTVNEFVDKVGDSITGKQAGENGNAAKGAETVRAGELETEQGRRMLEPERPPQNM